MKRVILLGATGSIGASACDIVRARAGAFRVVALAARRNRAAAEALAREFGARAYTGEDAALRAVEENDADIVVVATVGLSGLAPTLAAIEKGMTVALATKEVLVAAGELVTARARAKGVRILPVDSEHSAIFQCLQENAAHGAWARNVESLTLTASGGPFLRAPADLAHARADAALAHPTWKMGRKVTIDSATMMNKGFEIVEARWLFDVPFARIRVAVHPQSVVHSLVTFTDGSTLAQLSRPDMRVPVQYALTWPERLAAPERAPLDLAGLGSLTFEAPDAERFPCLELPRAAAEQGGVKAAALSAADEVAVERYLNNEICFGDIARLARDVTAGTPDVPCTFENIIAADEAARKLAKEWTFS